MTLPDASRTPDSAPAADPSASRPVVRINRERLWGDLMRLKEIGGYDAAISWRRLTLRGAAAHAGTAPIEARRDAGLAEPVRTP